MSRHVSQVKARFDTEISKFNDSSVSLCLDLSRVTNPVGDLFIRYAAGRFANQSQWITQLDAAFKIIMSQLKQEYIFRKEEIQRKPKSIFEKPKGSRLVASLLDGAKKSLNRSLFAVIHLQRVIGLFDDSALVQEQLRLKKDPEVQYVSKSTFEPHGVSYTHLTPFENRFFFQGLIACNLVEDAVDLVSRPQDMGYWRLLPQLGDEFFAAHVGVIQRMIKAVLDRKGCLTEEGQFLSDLASSSVKQVREAMIYNSIFGETLFRLLLDHAGNDVINGWMFPLFAHCFESLSLEKQVSFLRGSQLFTPARKAFVEQLLQRAAIPMIVLLRVYMVNNAERKDMRQFLKSSKDLVAQQMGALIHTRRGLDVQAQNPSTKAKLHFVADRKAEIRSQLTELSKTAFECKTNKALTQAFLNLHAYASQVRSKLFDWDLFLKRSRIGALLTQILQVKADVVFMRASVSPSSVFSDDSSGNQSRSSTDNTDSDWLMVDM